MAKFTFTAPDGKKHIITAPDGTTPEQAYEVLQQQIGTTEEPQATAPAVPASPGFEPQAYGSKWRDAYKAIQELPEEQREAALEGYANYFVGQERKGGGTLQAANDYARMFSRNLPVVGEWLDEARADLRSKNSDEYNMQLALEHARRRAIDEEDKTAPGIETGFGKVTGGDVAKAAGFLTGGAFLPARIAGMGAKVGGAVLGGVDAAADASGMKRGTAGEKLAAGITAAPVGAVTGGAISGASAAIGNKLARQKPKIDTDAVSKVSDEASKIYQKADKTGAYFNNTTPLKELGGRTIGQEIHGRIKSVADSAGYLKGPHQYIKAVMKHAKKLSEDGVPNITFKELERMRQALVSVSQSKDATERRMAALMTEELDDLVTRMSNGRTNLGKEVRSLASPAVARKQRTADKHYRTARDAWHRAAKAKRLEAAIEEAGDRSAATGIGGNFDNAMRQELRKVAKQKGFSATEREAIKDLARGDWTQNTLRSAGRFSPAHHTLSGGVGLGGIAAGTAAGVVNPAALAVPAVGYLAAQQGDRRIRHAAQALMTQVAEGRITPELLPRPVLQEMLYQASGTPYQRMLESVLRRSAVSAGVIADDPNKE